VWSYALELTEALGAFGTEVSLAIMGPALSKEQSREADRLWNLEVFQSPCRLEWMEDPWDDVRRAGEWLLELERTVRPELVHLNGFSHGALPWRVPKLIVAHSCVLSWWRAVKGTPAPECWDRYREAVLRGLQAADLIITPSRAMLRALEESYGILPPCRVIPNGREASRFTPVEKEPFILAAGRLWDEAKNIAALEAVAGDIPWPIYVAGDDTHPNGRNSRHQDVTSLGRLSSACLAGWYGRASIYALPVRYEPFGLTVLEAALAGCALVLGDIPSLREFWEGAACFVQPADVESLKSALQGLIADPQARRALGEKARAKALTLTSEQTVEGYVSAYSDLLSMVRTVSGARPEEVMECAS